MTLTSEYRVVLHQAAVELMNNMHSEEFDQWLELI